MYGGGSGTIATCGCSQQVRLMILRTRLVVRGVSFATRFTVLTGCGVLAIFTMRYSVFADWVSATCTAPPPMIAQPAAQADNFARAILTDISVALFVSVLELPSWLGAAFHLPPTTQTPVNGTTAFTWFYASHCGNDG